jgi:hypothetical protein
MQLSSQQSLLALAFAYHCLQPSARIRSFYLYRIWTYWTLNFSIPICSELVRWYPIIPLKTSLPWSFINWHTLLTQMLSRKLKNSAMLSWMKFTKVIFSLDVIKQTFELQSVLTFSNCHYRCCSRQTYQSTHQSLWWPRKSQEYIRASSKACLRSC